MGPGLGNQGMWGPWVWEGEPVSILGTWVGGPRRGGLASRSGSLGLSFPRPAVAQERPWNLLGSGHWGGAGLGGSHLSVSPLLPPQDLCEVGALTLCLPLP